MKILIISKGIPTATNPQFGCFAMDQAKALQGAGHDVAIMFVNGYIGKIWKKPGFYKWKQNGIKCYESYGYPTAILKKGVNLSMGLALEKWWSRKTFKRVVEDFGFPDIVHAHFLESMVIGAAIKEEYPIILIGTEHWSKLAESSIRPEIMRFGKYAYPMLDELICVSDNLAGIIKRNFNKDSVVVHNLFNTELLRPALSKTGNETYTICAVGSLIPRKGFDILIRAFAASKLSHLNACVNIYGEGSSRGELEKLISDLNLEGRVKLCGQKTKAEIYEALRKSDLFVLSSRQETFSVAIIEALGNGTPAVATSCGIVAEHDFDDVIKIPVDDLKAMKEALEKSYDRRNEIDRIGIQNQTIENFSPNAIVSQLEKVYDEALKMK